MEDKIFTEEQYQAIAKAGDKAANEFFGFIDSRVDFEELLRMEAPNQDNVFYPEFNLYNQEIMAIANQLTRAEAHEQLVEKEKKYRWKYKKTDVDGDYHYLSRISGLIELSYSIGPAHLTEKQVIEAGYNPDMFDREEVEC